MARILRRGLAVGVLASILLCPAVTQAQLKVGAATSTTQVWMNKTITTTSAANLKSAKNESESFQAVMTATSAVTVVNAAMSALTGPGGATIASSNATLYRVEYVYLSQMSLNPEPGYSVGYYPDPLIPFIDPLKGGIVHQSRGYSKYALPIDIPAGQNRAVWVDISVPKTAAEGSYSGTFTVTLSDSSKYTLPVNLTVWNFALPDAPTLKQYWIRTFWYITQFYGVTNGTPEYYALERRHADLFKQNHMIPPLPNRFTPQGNPDGSLYYTEYPDSLKAWVRDFHMNNFVIPPIASSSSDAAFTKYFTNYKSWLNANGMSDMTSKAWYYLWDEPGSADNYASIARLGALVPSDVPCLVTEQTYPENSSWTNIDPATDIWCPLWGFIDEASNTAKQNQGDITWGYQCCSQYTPTYHPSYSSLYGKRSPWWQIDRPALNYRFAGWISYRYNNPGFLYWQVMSTRMMDPWTSVWDGYSNGEGHLVYPGNKCGFNAPCPSTRMKVVRDGLEDYEYVVLEEQLKGKTTAMSRVKTVSPNWYDCTTDLNVVEQTRATLAADIAGGTVSQVTLSGTITGANGVTVTLSGGATGSQTVNGGGTYSFAVASGGTYTVTPFLTGYTFTPVSKTFTAATASQTQAFTAQAVAQGGGIAAAVPSEARPGTEITLQIMAQNVTGLFGTGFVVNYPSGTKIVSGSPAAGSFLGSDIVFYPNVNETTRQVQVGLSQKSGQSGVSGQGILMTARFTVDASVAAGTKLPFTITNVTATGPVGASMTLTPVADTVVVVTTVPVWPGDTNNDGSVSQADVLPLGLHWGKTGAARTGASNTWSAQQAQPWTTDGAVYADASGDGTVDQGDILGIGLNWGKTHAAAKPVVASAAKTVATGAVSAQSVAVIPMAAGTEFWVDIDLQDVIGLFGLSLILTYDHADLVRAVAVDNGGLLGNDVILLPQIDGTSGTVAVGISRKLGQTGIDGEGTAVRVKFRALSAIGSGTGITLAVNDVAASDVNGNAVTLQAKGAVIGSTTGINEAPTRFQLGQNYPNPFNPSTTIEYDIPQDGAVRVEVMNVGGQVVRVLLDGYQSQGRHSVVWDARDDKGNKVSAGAYFYRVKAVGITAVKKMMLLQ